jgi:hypothetical protein
MTTCNLTITGQSITAPNITAVGGVPLRALSYDLAGGSISYYTVPPSLPNATNYGDYLFYNGAAWTVGTTNIKLGSFAGSNGQGDYAVALGYGAGSNAQKANSIAIGNNAGNDGQGSNSIAIGAFAGKTNQNDASIVINATGTELNTQQTSSFYAAPIRIDTDVTNAFLQYNTARSEIVYNNGAIPTIKDTAGYYPVYFSPVSGFAYYNPAPAPAPA